MPKSLVGNVKSVSSSSPSTSNLVMAVTSKSVGLITTKRNMNPFTEDAQNSRKLKIKAILVGMSWRESKMRS